MKKKKSQVRLNKEALTDIYRRLIVVEKECYFLRLQAQREQANATAEAAKIVLKEIIKGK